MPLATSPRQTMNKLSALKCNNNNNILYLRDWQYTYLQKWELVYMLICLPESEMIIFVICALRKQPIIFRVAVQLKLYPPTTPRI